MKMYVLFLLLFQGGLSQSLANNDYSGLNYTPEETSITEGVSVAIHPKNGTIYLHFRENGDILQFTESGQVDTLGNFTIEFNKAQILDVHPNGSELLFWDSGVGRVHSFDLNTLEITRLDESHSHMNQFSHAATLDKSGNIYAMGGYGYWEFKNHLIYYSQSDRQWELHSKPDPDTVPKNYRGRLFRTDNTFYYFINTMYSGNQYSYAYKYLPNENQWVPDQQLIRLFSDNLVDVERSHTSFTQTSTYAIDQSQNLIGLLQHSRSQSHYAYLIELEESRMYRLDLSQLNIYDAKNLFYVPGKGHWVILGHSFSTNRRDQLILRTFEFDPDHPALSKVEVDEQLVSGNMIILGGFGGLFLLIIGWLAYKSIASGGESSKPTSEKVTLLKNDESKIEVYFSGEQFIYSGDTYLTRFIELIYSLKKNGISEILISDLDQKLFPENTHASYKSRTRKKLIQVFNQESSSHFIEERKSQTDKRVKVVYLNLNKINIAE